MISVHGVLTVWCNVINWYEFLKPECILRGEFQSWPFLWCIPSRALSISIHFKPDVWRIRLYYYILENRKHLSWRIASLKFKSIWLEFATEQFITLHKNWVPSHSMMDSAWRSSQCQRRLDLHQKQLQISIIFWTLPIRYSLFHNKPVNDPYYPISSIVMQNFKEEL